MKRITILLILYAALLFPVQLIAQQNVKIEIYEKALNKIVDPYRVGVLNAHGSGPPLCVVNIPEFFRACHVIGFFQCPPLSPGVEMPGDLPDPWAIPMAVCETVGGETIFVPTLGVIVQWKYMITEWKIKVSEGEMKFSATVNTEVESVQDTVTKEVPAKIVFDSNTHRLRMEIDPFEVELEYEGCLVKKIFVNKIFSFAIPFELQQLSVPLSTGGSSQINVRAKEVNPTYINGVVILNVDVEFF